MSSTGKPLLEHVTMKWIYDFMMRFNIVIRKQSGSLVTSEMHQVYIAKQISYHLGQLKRGFDEGTLVDELVENLDETHFIFNMDYCRTLGFYGKKLTMQMFLLEDKG
eukprot:IDg6701t1